MDLRSYLKLREAQQITDLDSPAATLIHAEIIRKKPFLKKIYKDYYAELSHAFNGRTKDLKIVEIGSGGGFIKEIYPNAFTTEILDLPTVDLRCSGAQLPFKSGAIDAFFMINVLHHIPRPRVFFNELSRCLTPGGKAVMIEPANSVWGRYIYTRFHHEPFDPDGEWTVEAGKPLSAANGALPWIIFERDRSYFNEWLPQLKIAKIHYHTPFRYLLSGGVSMRQLVPTFTYPIIKGVETLLSPFGKLLGMFMTVEIEKK